MVVRTLFDRDNTIIFNNQVNLGRNPITEIFYGGSPNIHSRYLFHFDETNLKSEIECGKLGDVENLRHTLRMTATASLNEDLLGTENCDGKKRTGSFTLVVFKIEEDWDEGHGFDGRGSEKEANSISSIGASNWLFARTNTPWSTPGVIDNSFTGDTTTYTGLTNYVAHQDFDLGNENIEIDLTESINDIILNGGNNGFGIAFSGLIETIETNVPRFVSFFTKDTNTFFEPFIESKSIVPLRDNRNNFTFGGTQQLCIYPSIDGEQLCLDEKPTVTIRNDEDVELVTIPSSGVTKYNGAYCVNVNLNDIPNITDCTTFTDTWSNLLIDGVDSGEIVNEFFVNPSQTVSFDFEETKLNDYIITLTGIKREERILAGDIRKVLVNVKIPFTSRQQRVVDDLEYRLYVREGLSEFTVTEYHPVEMASQQNYFFLDTNSLVPNTYYIDVRVNSNGVIRQLKEVLRFDIISQSNYRNRYN